uniref:Anaphase-promoting complex subunit 10 n=1 Tax=Aquila chrysaetos chrysaetos TaxID=223781 RepID=A0A663E2D1_AQUCH
ARAGPCACAAGRREPAQQRPGRASGPRLPCARAEGTRPAPLHLTPTPHPRYPLQRLRGSGFGVDQLRDDNLETYWQSDGSQPHLVNIQFRRKTTVKTLCIYADYKSDESYTPSKISVRVGNNFHNLQEIRQLELVEPSGWIHVPLTDTHKKPIRTFMIQIAVLANHQNGRDTHMRQIKVYTPVEESSIGKFPRCTTIDFMMYRSIR